VITLVLGGASSGKSEVAERLAGRDGAVTYVATGIAVDDDMAARIDRHRERRPAGWGLVEATGGDLPGALAGIQGAVLLDALGTWVASFDPFTAGAAEALCAALSARAGDTVVVSDEVGLGVHPSTELGRRFREDLGRLNQAIAGVADEVLLVIAGRVLRLEAV
jgi:adenosyl cobinamide kinase/adenosyl cobinamide phosphate guanylyltransferase